jgi:hypothetical protein
MMLKPGPDLNAKHGQATKRHLRSDYVETPRDRLAPDVEQRLSLGRCLHLYDVRHVAIDCGRWRFIRLVDDQLNSGLHHRCRHWVSFVFRGTDVKRLYAAHDAMPGAAMSAVQMVRNMRAAGVEPRLILYEFHPKDDIWFPSFAEMEDGGLVTDNNILIAVENLPTQASLGIILSEERPILPDARLDE